MRCLDRVQGASCGRRGRRRRSLWLGSRLVSSVVMVSGRGAVPAVRRPAGRRVDVSSSGDVVTEVVDERAAAGGVGELGQELVDGCGGVLGDVVEAAWAAAGRPRTLKMLRAGPRAAAGSASQRCARCDGSQGGVLDVRQVVSLRFTARDCWIHPSGSVLCGACSWSYQHRAAAPISASAAEDAVDVHYLDLGDPEPGPIAGSGPAGGDHCPSVRVQAPAPQRVLGPGAARRHRAPLDRSRRRPTSTRTPAPRRRSQ